MVTPAAVIFGVSLVRATGAGASARKSIGIAVFSGMLASTCLAVLFVPSFSVILQRWQERRNSPVSAPTRSRQSPPANICVPEPLFAELGRGARFV